MRITLIRHGKTEGNLKGCYVGRTDAPLCSEGVEEAERGAKDPDLRRVYVSPMRRARETAAILFPNAKQIVIEAFREMDFGDFEGRSAKEMEHDPAYRAWVDGYCQGACPGGESRTDFRARVCSAFQKILQALDSDAVFVVHGGVIMSILAEYCEPKRDFYDWRTDNLAGYTVDVSSDGIGLIDPHPVRYGGKNA